MQKIIEFKDFYDLTRALGPEDKYLKRLQEEYKVKIYLRQEFLFLLLLQSYR